MTSPSRVVSVEARPGPLTIDLTHSAVLVIDMQNDFGAQGGMFERAGIDISDIQRAVDPTRCVIAAARNAGVLTHLIHAPGPDRSVAVQQRAWP